MAQQLQIDELEAAIKQLPGVLGCVILAGGDGTPTEIQAFTQVGTDREEIQARILDEVKDRDLGSEMSQVFVFELEAESYFGDLESLERAAEFAEQEARTRGPVGQSNVRQFPTRQAREGDRRPKVRRVALTSSSWTSEATVALGAGEGDDIVGQASAEKTPHGLRVLAEATLSAVSKIVDDVEYRLKSASLVNVGGQEAVLVLVGQEGGPDMLGAALARGGPLTEITVRATLDAINRRLTRG